MAAALGLMPMLGCAKPPESLADNDANNDANNDAGALHDGAQGDARPADAAMSDANTMATLAPCTTRRPDSDPGGPWRFTEVALAVGLDAPHVGVDPTRPVEQRMVYGGLAAGDYDGDCLVDLYILTGATRYDRLFHNQGDGTFADVTESSGLAIDGASEGVLFVDLDGDGLLDLFVGHVEEQPSALYLNQGVSQGHTSFVARPDAMPGTYENFSVAAADYDRDGDLDLFTAHWKRTNFFDPGYLWNNDGQGVFIDQSAPANLATGELRYLFTPNFTDLDNDGWLDVVVSGDWSGSRVLMNRGPSGFENVTNAVISDENGMGAAVGDVDNDGVMDWFVSSIHDPNMVAEGNWGVTGNRLYRGLGDGTFEDITEAAGVREGYWGWGSCLADFDNNGYLDIFHVNGMGVTAGSIMDEFLDDPSRLFISNGDGTFSERSVELGIDDRGQGRGVSCLDYDRDGDIDIIIAGNGDPVRLYRNQGQANAGGGNFLGVRLLAPAPNTAAIGARVRVTTGAVTQTREIRAGNNYASQDPAEAHFGVNAATVIDELEITWPDGSVNTFEDVPVNDVVTVSHPGA